MDLYNDLHRNSLSLCFMNKSHCLFLFFWYVWYLFEYHAPIGILLIPHFSHLCHNKLECNELFTGSIKNCFKVNPFNPTENVFCKCAFLCLLGKNFLKKGVYLCTPDTAHHLYMTIKGLVHSKIKILFIVYNKSIMSFQKT